MSYDDRELPISGTIVSSSILVGLTTSLILFCSHFHQVRLGTEAGVKVVKVAVSLLYSTVLILGLSQALPFSSVVRSWHHLFQYLSAFSLDE